MNESTLDPSEGHDFSRAVTITAGMNAIRFHARITAGRKEFVCDRCGGPVVEMPGEQQNPDQMAHVMYCRQCNLASGGWLTASEREVFLRNM